MCVRSDKITKVQREQRRTIPEFYFQIFDYFFHFEMFILFLTAILMLPNIKYKMPKFKWMVLFPMKKKMFYVGRFKGFVVPCCWWRCHWLESLQELQVAPAGAAVYVCTAQWGQTEGSTRSTRQFLGLYGVRVIYKFTFGCDACSGEAVTWSAWVPKWDILIGIF